MSVPATTMRIDPEPKDEANKVPGMTRPEPVRGRGHLPRGCRARAVVAHQWASSRAGPTRETDRRSKLTMMMSKRGRASAKGLPAQTRKPAAIAEEGGK